MTRGEVWRYKYGVHAGCVASVGPEECGPPAVQHKPCRTKVTGDWLHW